MCIRDSFDSGHTQRINAIGHFFSPEYGNLIVTAGCNPHDNYMKIWNTEKGYMVGMDLLKHNAIKNGILISQNIENEQGGITKKKYQVVVLQSEENGKDSSEIIIYDTF
eukprot:TRINITY_DN1553_c0_g1_i6.p2 TRINITY_DN1553_c0_g1~~TRINITY_DN1553_c0_g1_i6.p2  ORF type:complete len:109 (+),score=23.06 TRINITY_DN1553_c0_g1_i6:127-453(+)